MLDRRAGRGGAGGRATASGPRPMFGVPRCAAARRSRRRREHDLRRAGGSSSTLAGSKRATVALGDEPVDRARGDLAPTHSSPTSLAADVRPTRRPVIVEDARASTDAGVAGAVDADAPTAAMASANVAQATPSLACAVRRPATRSLPIVGRRRRVRAAPPTATSPTRGWPPPSSSPSRCADRCCSRARRASARPRWPRCWRAWTGGELIRLQCYEGIDAAQAVYDWDYARQLLHLRAAEASGEAAGRRHRRARGRALPGALPRQAGAAAGDRATATVRRRCC